MPAVPADRIVGCASGGVIAGGRFSAAAIAAFGAGIWTWFTDPRAVYYNGSTYIGCIDSAGNVWIIRYHHATGTTTSYLLWAALEIDDHNNPAIFIRPDGRIMVITTKHNDSSGIRIRTSTNPEDITAWGAQVVISAGITLPVSYSNPRYLSAAGLLLNHYRAGTPPNAPHCYITTTDFVNWSSGVSLFTVAPSSARPYVKSCTNGVDRIDFFLTNCHPNEGAASVYHCYARWHDGALHWYNSGGAELTLPINPTTMLTPIYSGASVDAWVWDIAYGLDGRPRVLFTRYPTTTDQRFMFSRWTGSEWTTPVEVTNGGQYLYAAEQFYSGGIVFDSARPDTVYLSKQVGAYWEIQQWHTDDDGLTWAKQRDITSGSTGKNCRPYSPLNHNGDLPVLWWAGTYTTYINYNTVIKGLRR